MRIEELRTIDECLPTERRLLRYYKDRYAAMLLAHVIGDGMSVRELKRSAFARLLERPPIRSVLAMLGEGVLTRDLLELGAPCESVEYLLTFGSWGYSTTRRQLSHYQTTRPGHNLVLQVNFTGRHNEIYRRLLRPREGMHPFIGRAHPVAGGELLTLSWARIDLDLSTGEALIEEIQNDWIRRALARERWLRERAEEERKCGAGTPNYRQRFNEWSTINSYIEMALAPHLKVWDEITLAATIEFIRKELGIGRIFYHTHESGALLKRIRGTAPPRSIYSSLPRSFCFRECDALPEFLARDNRWMRRNASNLERTRFQLLEL